MGYVIITIIAFGSGIALGYYLLYEKQKKVSNERLELYEQRKKLDDNKEKLQKMELELKEWDQKIQTFEKRVISYEELRDENIVLKTDLQNMDVKIRKGKLDQMAVEEKQKMLDQKVNEVGKRYLDESVKWIGSRMTPNNYVISKDKLVKVIELCRGIGFDIPEEREGELVSDLKREYEKIVRADFERQEQSRIKAQIREEQRLEREVQKELDRLERERAAIQAALEKALREAKDKHSEEIERLQARLKEAEEKSQRAISQAQLTKSGYVYVISNIGSFGNDVFKIGMTRRLEPEQRVRELGDASVPFPFDIHMMISSNDAPSLEYALHQELHKNRLNKIKPRKEFFKTDINTIKGIVERNHGEVSYIADAEALEYYQSQNMSEEDEEYIEQVYNSVEDEEHDELPE